MTRKYCNPSMIKEYIELYTKRRVKWDRFNKIISHDFSPEFLKEYGDRTQRAYEFKLSISEELRVKYNRVA